MFKSDKKNIFSYVFQFEIYLKGMFDGLFVSVFKSNSSFWSPNFYLFLVFWVIWILAWSSADAERAVGLSEIADAESAISGTPLIPR